MASEHDENPVLLQVKPRGYTVANHDYMVPGSGEHTWTLQDLEQMLAVSGFHIIRKEDKKVLDACAAAVLFIDGEGQLIGLEDQRRIWESEKGRRAAKESRIKKKEKTKRAPVQPSFRDAGLNLRDGLPGSVPGSIAWEEHLEAYIAYAARYGRKQSAAKIAARGGFEYLDLELYLGRNPTTWKADQVPVRSRTLKV